jgi:hypothetical protein
MSKVSFSVCDVKPEQFPIPITLKDHLEKHKIVKENKGTILMTTVSPNEFAPPFGNGFIGTVFMAYSKHYHLVLRPDDVWSAIMMTLADYIDTYSEEMRSQFVSHEGQKELIAYAGGSIHCIPLAFLIDQLTTKIDKNLKKELKDWVIPNFSTTTSKDKIIGGITLMGAIKKYFSYGFMLDCGLPGATLEGTLEDWQLLRKKIDRLLEFGGSFPPNSYVLRAKDFKEWHALMAPILDKFVDTYQKAMNNEEVDKTFWNQICNRVSGGSGPSYISGWINVFIPFKKGKFVIEKKTWYNATSEWGFIQTDSIPSSSVDVPVKINDNGREYNTLLYAGSIMGEYNKDTNEIRPSVNMALIDITK